MKAKTGSMLALFVSMALSIQGCGSVSPTAVPTAIPTAAGAGVAPLPDAISMENTLGATGRGAANADAPQPIACGETTDEALIAQVIVLVNAERAKVGAGPLTENAQLKAAAKVHNNNMACLNFFDHTGQDGSQPAERATAQGYQWANTGENIAAGQSTAEAVMRSWMNSPGHKANILNPDFTEIGLAFAAKTGSQWTRYWTQVFGRPLNDGGGQPTPQPPAAATPTAQPPAAATSTSQPPPAPTAAEQEPQAPTEEPMMDDTPEPDDESPGGNTGWNAG